MWACPGLADECGLGVRGNLPSRGMELVPLQVELAAAELGAVPVVVPMLFGDRVLSLSLSLGLRSQPVGPRRRPSGACPGLGWFLGRPMRAVI